MSHSLSPSSVGNNLLPTEDGKILSIFIALLLLQQMKSDKCKYVT